MTDVPAPLLPLQPNNGLEARPLLGIMLRLAAMVMLGVMFVLVKLAAERGVHLVESLFWRQLTGLPVVILWLWSVGKLHDVRTANPAAHSLRSILGLSGMALNFAAMTMLPMAEATTISFASPIFATLLAAVLLSEPTGKYRWGAVALGFIGVLLAMRPGTASHGIGPWVALAGALLTAAVTIQLRKMSKHENTGAIVFWFSLISLIPLGIGLIIVSKSHDATTWAIVAGLAICGAIAQLLLTSAMRHASVATVATMDYSGLIWSVLFGYMVFDALPDRGTWIGAPLIIAAGLIIIWREQKLGTTRLNIS